MWGHSLQFWQTVVFWLWAATAVGGGLAVTASLFSSIVSNSISVVTTKQSDVAIAEANAAGELARAEAEKARSQAAGAEQRAAEANKIAADARLEIARLRGPRNLSEEFQASLTKRLLPFGPKDFCVGVLIGGLEPGSDLAKQTVTLLNAAKWRLVPFRNRATARGQPIPNEGISAIIGIVGVKIFYNSERAAEFRAVANFLSNALNEDGIAAESIELPASDEADPNSLRISIGAKT